jgi:hypothetical protein
MTVSVNVGKVTSGGWCGGVVGLREGVVIGAVGIVGRRGGGVWMEVLVVVLL